MEARLGDLAGAALLAALAAPAAAEAPQARLERLQLKLLNAPSATVVLGEWCREYDLSPDAEIRALRIDGPPKAPSPQDLDALGAATGEPIAYRRVRLVCGDRVLSEADNWYRPARLSPEMLQLLDTTDTPFGAVVAPLGFQRRTLSSHQLSGSGFVLQHRALLTTPDGVPFSLVVESYTAEVLAGSQGR